jgi:hypothetical protein
MLVEELALLEEILGRHTDVLGIDFTGYRNHVYRVTNLCLILAGPSSVPLDKLVVAAAFHDLGIWTHGTFDYIPPSIELARAHLQHDQRAGWEPEVSAMIADHHKLRALRAPDQQLVELFRRADWVDVTLGVRSFGVTRAQLRELFERFPDAGFHRRLVELTLRRSLRHPLSPLPMLRW